MSYLLPWSPSPNKNIPWFKIPQMQTPSHPPEGVCILGAFGFLSKVRFWQVSLGDPNAKRFRRTRSKCSGVTMAGTRFTGQAPLDFSRLHESLFFFQIIPGWFSLCFFPTMHTLHYYPKGYWFPFFLNGLAALWPTLQQNQAGTTLHDKPMPFEEGPSGLGRWCRWYPLHMVKHLVSWDWSWVFLNIWH